MKMSVFTETMGLEYLEIFQGKRLKEKKSNCACVSRIWVIRNNQS